MVDFFAELGVELTTEDIERLIDEYREGGLLERFKTNENDAYDAFVKFPRNLRQNILSQIPVMIGIGCSMQDIVEMCIYYTMLYDRGAIRSQREG
jgi:hypothetical protein